MTDTATDFIESFDSRAWAAAFVATVKAHPAIATDEATMTGWFANALMRGYDEHAVRANGGGRIIHNGDHLASLLGETEETREPSMTADDPTCDPTPDRAEPERRYAKQFIPASQSKDGHGHWRIADGEDNRVATCWDSFNADRIVDALNFWWNNSVRRPSSVPPQTEPDEGGTDDVLEVAEWLECDGYSSAAMKLRGAVAHIRREFAAPAAISPRGNQPR